MSAIYPAVWVNRRLSGASNHGQPLDETGLEKKTNEELAIIPVVNEILAWLLSQEAGWLAGGHRLPFGTSLLAVGKKQA
jgi:hypothetical protein